MCSVEVEGKAEVVVAGEGSWRGVEGAGARERTAECGTESGAGSALYGRPTRLTTEREREREKKKEKKKLDQQPTDRHKREQPGREEGEGRADSRCSKMGSKPRSTESSTSFVAQTCTK